MNETWSDWRQEAFRASFSHLSTPGDDANFDLRTLPFLVSLGVVSTLCFQFLTRTSQSSCDDDELTSRNAPERIVKDSGGTIRASFISARVLGCLALTALSTRTLLEQCSNPSPASSTFKHLVYSSESPTTASLCIASLFSLLAASSSPWRASTTRGCNAILFALCGVYSYRDVWPLATYTESPMDAAEGGVLWIKVVLLYAVAIFIPLFIPRKYVPVNPKEPVAREDLNPEQTCSIASLIIYAFLDPLLLKGYSAERLGYDQLPPLADAFFAKNLRKRAFKHLDPFQTKTRRHIVFGILRALRREYITMGLICVVQSASEFAFPLSINRLLRYLESGGHNATVKPWFWIVCLVSGQLFKTICTQGYTYMGTRAHCSATAFITQLVFEHMLRIRMKAEVTRGDNPSGKKESMTKNMIGKINNLVTSDLAAITGNSDILLLLISVPLQITLCLVFLYNILGWSAFVGFGVIAIMVPIPSLLAKQMRKNESLRAKATDARVQDVSEAIQVMRMIKLFGWERQIFERVQGKRNEEIRHLRRIHILSLSIWMVNRAAPVITMLATYGVYTTIMGKELSAAIVFSSINVFTTLRTQLDRINWQIAQTVSAKVSLDRLQAFLRETELLDLFDSKEMLVANQTTRYAELTTAIPERVESDPRIGFQNVDFSWSSEQEAADEGAYRLRIGDEISFKSNALNLIIGPTGSGKTSVLMALLGEMHALPKNTSSWSNLPRQLGVAYAPQESWVQSATIRDNIIFETPFDEDRYKKVLHQCALERDLELFEAGDSTEVGERGITLSGGQKARLTFARAVYSHANIVLLDDIFAALDVHTSSWIVEKCLKGELLKDRTVLLVTHNVSLVRPLASFVVEVREGKVTVQTSQDMEAVAFPDLDPTREGTDTDPELPDTRASDTQPLATKANGTLGSAAPSGKLILPEEIAVGHITWPSFNLLLSAMGGKHKLLYFTGFVAAHAFLNWCLTLQVWWLGFWGAQYEGRDASDVRVLYYLGVASVISAGMLLCNAAYAVVFVAGSVRASRSIHEDMFNSILISTMRWLDSTPSGRILTRCTQDIRAVDKEIPSLLSSLTNRSTEIITKLAAVTIFTPLFIGPSMVIAGLGFHLGNFYLKTQLSVSREMSNAKAPMLSHFSATLAGLVCIRAYGVQDSMKHESMSRIDHYSRIARVSFNLNRWIGVRIDLLGSLFIASLAVYLVYCRPIGASNTGFSLNMAIDFATSILWWVRSFNLFETQANSLERIGAYMNIEHEPPPLEGGKPPAAWPTSGDLRVENLSARYSSDGPEILHSLSFHISAGERVGVVGRTGSGKSTLALALLRCIPTEGAVWFDGLRTKDINLEALRSNFTIIPQMPELLSGTLRRNLDPFSEHDDLTLNNALRSAGFSSLRQQEAGSDSESGLRFSLDTEIAGGGSNLSLGERQMVALARAIVRRSKVLILDEATSAIDYETNTAVQSTLAREVGADVTVITIAHRLQTIMDSDRIMVLDGGSIVEFDKPSVLLARDDSFLAQLVRKSQSKTA